MRWYPRVAALLVVALLAASCAGTPQDTPEATLRHFYDRLNAGATADVKAMYKSETRSMLEDPAQTSPEAFAEWVTGETKDGTVSDLSIVDQKVEDDSAEITYDVRFRDGSKNRRTVSLVRESGAWKLDLVR